MGDGKSDLTPEELKQREEDKKQKLILTEDQLREQAERKIAANKQRRLGLLETLLKTSIAPQEDRVVVWPDAVEEKTESGLYKPEVAIEKERPHVGTVISVGPGKRADEQITHTLLLNMLQYGTDIPEKDFDELKSQVFDMSIPLKAGDRILYGRFAGTPVEDPETKEMLLIMRPTDIFAKV